MREIKSAPAVRVPDLLILLFHPTDSIIAEYTIITFLPKNLTEQFRRFVLSGVL